MNGGWMSTYEEYLEKVWNGILSEEPEIILDTFHALDDADQKVIISHLKKMVSETGWHPAQVQSASTAMRTIQNQPNS